MQLAERLQAAEVASESYLPSKRMSLRGTTMLQWLLLFFRCRHFCFSYVQE